MLDILTLSDKIEELRATLTAERAVLVALSGIDGSGKGFVARLLANHLRDKGYGVAVISIDGWLNLPQQRFDLHRPAEHFYRCAIRFDGMFARLVLPLRDHRSVDIEADHVEETATAYSRKRYCFQSIDIVLLEGIYLLKRAFRHHYDLRVWLECTFETALERAIARSQEGLSPVDTIRAYRTIYFPAQEIHFRQDGPAAAADVIVVNDDRLALRSY